jgi:hypothetical protein
MMWGDEERNSLLQARTTWIVQDLHELMMQKQDVQVSEDTIIMPITIIARLIRYL